MGYYTGIDIGGTNMVCGLLSEHGELIRLQQQKTDVHLGVDSVIHRIDQMIRDMISAEGLNIGQLNAVGIGTPGLVNPETGVVRSASNLKWKNVPLAQLVHEKIGVPVYIDNDVRMYVFGEAAAGAARKYDHVLGITLGTGIAAAMVNHGQLYYGKGFMAGELGHIKLPGITYTCGCGMIGCLEAVASATGIVRQTRELLNNGRDSVLLEWLAQEPDKLTSAEVSKAYDLGDSVAIEVMNQTGEWLGIGLSYAVTLLSPDILVIGGGASKAGERILRPMREVLQQRILPSLWEHLTIKLAERTDDAGVIGSALLAKQKFLS